QTIYAVLTDNSNTVLATSAIAANGSFSFAAAPAYMSGMNVIPVSSGSAPSVGAAAPAASWPNMWVGTKGQYGTNNLAGSGVYGL
ncbi:hypothetical protein LXA21_17950, partial [Erwinia amylovora]|uniref:hypothetical protein n=1 Tax=Erwinia amylovora TaxID=552 RepID=UPI0020BF4CD6